MSGYLKIKGHGAEGIAHGAKGIAHGAKGRAHGAEGRGHSAEGKGHGAEGRGQGFKTGLLMHPHLSVFKALLLRQGRGVSAVSSV